MGVAGGGVGGQWLGQPVDFEVYLKVLTPSLPWCHVKTANRSRKFEIIKPFYVFFALACEWIFIKTHAIEIRFVIGPGNMPFSGTYVHFSARKFYRLGQ